MVWACLGLRVQGQHRRRTRLLFFNKNKTPQSHKHSTHQAESFRLGRLRPDLKSLVGEQKVHMVASQNRGTLI